MQGLTRLLKKHYFLIPIDLLFAGYLLLISILTFIFQKNLNNWFAFISIHLGILTLSYFFIKKTHYSKNSLIKIIRNFYPLLLLLLLVKELTYFKLLVYPDWFDIYLIDFEMNIYNQHPTLLLQKIISIPLTFLTNLSSIFSFGMLLFPLIYFYKTGRQKLFNEFLESNSLTIFLYLLICIFVPIHGSKNELAVYYTSNIPTFLNFAGLIYLPLAITITSWRILNKYFRKLSYILIPFLLLVAFSGLYLRETYITGLIVTIITCWLALYLRDLYNEYFNARRKF
ncbi:MAG: hypothetical protein GY817_07940 [bacterium]|nr:hypothetical protein [bacterium]